MRLSVAIVLLATSASAAWAQGREETEAAKNHFLSATSYFERGEYEDAEREFLQAFRLSQRIDLFYNIARCQEQLGKLDDAITSLNKFLGERPNDSQGKRTLARLQNLVRKRDAAKAKAPPEPEPKPAIKAEPSIEPAPAAPLESSVTA